VSGMFENLAPHPAVGPLHLCAACRQPFIVPVARFGAAGLTRDRVQLSCDNCGWSEVAAHDHAALEHLDRVLDEQTAQMVAAVELLAISADIDRIDRFAQALHDGHILPEDF
jgi:hypothetical protein